MGKPFKIMLSIITVVVLLIVIAIFTLPYLIDPNSFKPELAAAVKDKTGRDMALTGDLKLAIFPSPCISTGKMTLSNAAGFRDRPFATLEESDIMLNFLPLLSNRIEISRITIKGLIINLEKKPQGGSNWDDLTASDTSKATPTPSTSVNNASKPDKTNALAALAIGGIAIENARINWDDQQSGKQLLIKDINFNAGKFSYDEPVAVDLSLIVDNPETKFTESIKLTTGLTINEKFDTLAFSHADLQTTTEGENIPGKPLTTNLTVADATLDIVEQTLKASGLVLKSKDVTLSAELTGNTINDKLSLQGPVSIAPFNPAKLMQQLGITVPVMQDANALSKSAATFNLLATENSIDLQNLAITLDDTQIKGSTSITDFALPVITFNLAANTIDVDRYFPPVTDKSSKPVISPAVAFAAGACALPVESLRKLNIDGRLSLDRLKINGLIMQDIQLNLSAKDGIITTQQSVKEFYQGSYSGSLSIDTHNNKPGLSLNEKILHVQAEPLLKDFRGEAKIGGVVDASAQLQGQGRSADELKASLNGNFSFLFKDSVVRGFNLQKMIDQAKALIKEPALPLNNKNDQTLFAKITGTATINNGLIQNNDLVATASRIHINGKGSADLNTEKLDYKINANFINAQAKPAEPEQASDTPINISIAGTFSQPTYTLDVAALLTEKNKAKIENFIDKNQEKIDNIVNKIDKKLGPGVGDLLKGLFKKH